jgi:hypothetical protein
VARRRGAREEDTEVRVWRNNFAPPAAFISIDCFLFAVCLACTRIDPVANTVHGLLCYDVITSIDVRVSGPINFMDPPDPYSPQTTIHGQRKFTDGNQHNHSSPDYDSNLDRALIFAKIFMPHSQIIYLHHVQFLLQIPQHHHFLFTMR